MDRTDTLQTAVDAVARSKAERVVLNIPRRSAIGGSIHDFQVLKRESETAGKEIEVESIDEHILEFASMAGISARNPIFRTKERTVTDIVPKLKTPPKPAVKEEPEPEPEPDWEEPPVRSKAKKHLFRRKGKAPVPVKRSVLDEPPPARALDEEGPEEEPTRPPRFKKPRRLKLVPTAIVLLAVVGIGYALAAYVLPRVTIDLTLKKTSFDVNNEVMVDSAATSVVADARGITLPGQLLIAKNNLVMNFKATGTSTVSAKASGTLVVYNTYSSAPQVLVATTRFVSPGGKLFRSTERITIPGAKVTGGTIEPSSATVHVLAAGTGPSYNVASSTHWTIPGFEGTARYSKFYADAPYGMSGGEDGVMPVATKTDLVVAEAQAVSSLKDSLLSQLGILSGGKFKILPASSVFATTSEKVTPAGADGQFSVLVAGEMREMVFDEGMLKDQLLTLSGASATGTKIDSFNVSYGTTTLALAKGLMSFNVSGGLVYEPAVDVASVKQKIAGADAASLKSVVFGITGLEKANIAFWPFYVTTVPADQSKIQLNLN